MTLPSAISECPLSAAITLTTSSGAEVPKATTVSPITNSEMPYLRAREEDPVTSQSPPFTKSARPATNKNRESHIKNTFEIRAKVKRRIRFFSLSCIKLSALFNKKQKQSKREQQGEGRVATATRD